MSSPSRPCPVLRTARLTLAPHTPDDLADCLAMWSDPVVVRYMGGIPATPREVWDRILRYAGLWSLFGYGYWRVGETATGRFVGDVGLGEFRREITPSILGVPEAGWSFMPWAHGRGYAREAAGAMLAWADEALLDARTVCMIHPDNVASLALASRLGFEIYARTQYKDRPELLLRRYAVRNPPDAS